MKLSFGLTHGLVCVFVVVIVLAASITSAKAAPNGGVVGNGTSGSCTESALNTALAGGGTVTFNCGGPKTITLTGVKTIAQDTIIMGGNVITLTGNFATRLFSVNSGALLRLQDIVLDKASVSGSDGGAISNHGTLVLENTTIQTSFTDGDHSGGALFTDGPASIINSTFRDNVGGSAGAIFANFGNAQVTIVNSTFSNNQAQNATTGYGGAIWVGNDAHVTVRDSLFLGNIAHFGGALFTSPAARLVLEGTPTGSIYSSQMSLISNRATEDGGGIYNTGQLSMERAVISVNRTPTDTILAGYGGGIYSHGVLTMTRSVVSSNQGRFGGGVFVGNSLNAQAVIDRSIFLSNLSGSLGGGLYTNIPTTTVIISNSVFNGNTAVGNGGGLARFNTNLKIFNSSFTYNTAAAGGGLALSAGPSPSSGPYVRLQSVTVSHNTATSDQGGGVYSTGNAELYFTTIVSNTRGVYSAFGGNTRFRSSVLHNPGSINCDGDGTVQVSNDGANHVTDNSCGPQFTAAGDPLLGPLQNDGSGTPYYHLPLAGSPLINVGYSNCPTLDQRGAARPDACDIGAVEFGGLLPRVYVPLLMK